MSKPNSLFHAFLSPEIQEKVERINKVDLCLPPSVKTPLDFLTIPHHWLFKDAEDRNVNLFDKIKNEVLKISPQLNQFHIYNLVACNYIESRAEMAKNPFVQKILHKEKPSLKELTQASLVAEKPMQAYWIKQMVCTYGYVDEFDGMQAYTSPVDKACKVLFGYSFAGDQYSHTRFCQELASEINVKYKVNFEKSEKLAYKPTISPTYINTALWWKGYNL